MRWLLYALLLGAGWGIYQSYPVIQQFLHWPEDEPLPQSIINRMLLCLGGALTWAIYLAATFVPWLAQKFIELLFSVKGLRQRGWSARPQANPSSDQPKNSSTP
jgi:hypothetical protein